MFPTFANPQWLWCLFLLLPLAGLRVWSHWRSRQGTRGLVSPRLAKELVVGAKQWSRWVVFSLQLLALASLLITMARPQWGYEITDTESESRNVIIAIDTSRSMLANDLTPDRITRAKLAAQDIVQSLPEDRIGLIAFAGKAFLQAPLTLDHDAVVESIQQFDTELIPRGGSNLTDAAKLAVEIFDKASSQESALIIFSDGEALEGRDELDSIVEDAKNVGLMVVSIGVGTQSGSIIPEPDEKGRPQPGVFVTDEEGKVVRTRLDPTALQELSGTIGGGVYLDLAATASVSKTVPDALRRIEATRGVSEARRRPIERFVWPLSTALFLIVAAWMLPGTTRWFQRVLASRPSRLETTKSPDSQPDRKTPPSLPASNAKALLQKLKSYQPRYVGITALSTIMPSVEIVADLCREEMGEDAVLIVGGEHPSFMKERMLLEYPVFDYLVYGEGEETLAELVHRLDAGELVDDVQGLIYRRGEEIVVNDPRPLIEDFDSLPFPARHLLPVERYIPLRHRGDYFRLPSASIMVSRGCPHDLNHCSKAVWGGTSRFRSARRILEEMKQCIKKYGIREFRFVDDNLTIPNGPISELCDLIIKKDLDVTWSCYSRVMGIKKHILAKMKEAGCYQIHYGIEVGTEKALKIVNLNTTLEQAAKAMDWTKEVGIECTCHFLLGLPGETWEDCEATVNFALKLNPDLGSFDVFEATPGSSLYGEPFSAEEGKPTSVRVPLERLEKLAARARFKFYFRLAWFMRALRRLNRNPKREISKNWAAVCWLFRMLLSRLRIHLPWNWETRSTEEAMPGERHAIEPSLESGSMDRHDQDKTSATGRKKRSEVIEVDRG